MSQELVIIAAFAGISLLMILLLATGPTGDEQ